MFNKEQFESLFNSDCVYFHSDTTPEHDINTQQGLVASLVDDIYRFDYWYNFSDDHAVWKKYHALKLDIQARLEKVEDVKLAANLSACFNKDSYKNVLDFKA